MSHDVERIGAYRIVRRLGRGGMGEVLLASDERLGRLVALKRIRGDVGADPTLRQRFRREARAVARLNHPNVVRIYDVLEGGDGEADTIVMEYVEGRSVAELLHDGALAPATAVDLAAQVARGLAAAHAAGLVHRDLKPSNVVVNRLGQAKVLDFGLVKPIDAGADSSVTENGEIVGTLRSLSPEQVLGERVDPKSDLFALGTLLYEMLSGARPFQAENEVATLGRILSAVPVPLSLLRPEVPADLVALVEALHGKEPEDRPESAAAVAAALEALARRPEIAGAGRML